MKLDELKKQIATALRLQMSEDAEERFNGGSELFDILGEHATITNPVPKWGLSENMKTNFINGLLTHCEELVVRQKDAKFNSYEPGNELAMVYEIGRNELTQSQFKKLLTIADQLCSKIGNVAELDQNGDPHSPRLAITELFVAATTNTQTAFAGSYVSTHFYDSAKGTKVAIVVSPEDSQDIAIIGRNCVSMQDLPALNGIAK